MTRKQMKPSNLYQEAERRLIEIQEVLEGINKEQKNSPPGKLHMVRSKRRVQYYIRKEASDKSGEYIRKSESNIIKQYLQKWYNEKLEKILREEEATLKLFLQKSNNPIQKIQSLYSNLFHESKKYLNPVDVSEEDFVKEWLSIPYESKQIITEAPDFISDKGDKVRSKSELLIANMLYKYNIPYKYECPLILNNGQIIYPDFTVLDVKRRKIRFWEHRGMMDDRDYTKHTVMRMKDYQKSGYFLGDSVIITEETGAMPLGTKEIEQIIKYYFL